MVFAWPMHRAWGQKQDLDLLRAKIEALRIKIASAEDARTEAREELRESEQLISKANRSVRELGVERDTARVQLRSLAAQRSRAENERARGEKELGAMLAALHRQGDPGYLRLVFSNLNPNQTARDIYLLSQITRAQSGLLSTVRAEVEKLRKIELEQREQSKKLAEIEAAEKASREALLAQRTARRAVLDKVSAQIRAQQKEFQGLQKDEARLSRLVTEIVKVIAETPRSARPDSPAEREQSTRPFSSLRGNLAFPARGAIAHTFGTVRPDGGPSWKGMFIRAGGGEEVRAVAAGRVVYAEWMRGFGNLLILDHGGEYLTIYGNNEALLRSVGDWVRSGEPIATVGASGGGQETGLYFEMRHEGKAFDPARWLARR
jgi:murein hydrolase activator